MGSGDEGHLNRELPVCFHHSLVCHQNVQNLEVGSSGEWGKSTIFPLCFSVIPLAVAFFLSSLLELHSGKVQFVGKQRC